MDNSDPVSPTAYWLPVSLILPAQPIGAVAAVSDVGMKGVEMGGGGIEVMVGKKLMMWGGERNGE